MQLLRDEELYELIVGATRPLVRDLKIPADWYSKESPIQPSSVDLSVGEIFVPPKAPQASGASYGVESDFTLHTGQTALIATAEKICLPGDIAAVGFPPSHVSILGLLITNPGHIDPGYEGPLHLTIINMGVKPYSIRKGDTIVSVVFHKLDGIARADFATRYGPPPYPSQASKSLKLAFDCSRVSFPGRRPDDCVF